MRLGILYSGGKDSTYALYLSIQQGFEATCLITIRPTTPESYMFHYPNVELTGLQADAMGLPVISKQTTGRKEQELSDLAEAIEESKSKYAIDGIVSGAIDSDYQKSRIDRISFEKGLRSFAPLWRKNPVQLLRDQLLAGFSSIICGVYAKGFDKTWLSRPINEETIQKLVKLTERFQIHASGEGGEYESFVLDAPNFKRELKIDQSSSDWDTKSETGTYDIQRAHLQDKIPAKFLRQRM